jgi:hypothetical protein
MKNKFLTSFGAIVVGLIVIGLSLKLQAAQPFINGAIGFGGNVMLDSSLANATTIWSYIGVSDNFGSLGTYTNLPTGTVATCTPFTFNPPDASVLPLWSCTNNGVVYSFEATSMEILFHNSNGLVIQGSGIAHITGFSDTVGAWGFSTQQPELDFDTYSFNASIRCSETNNPLLQATLSTNSQMVLNWNALPGQPYQVQCTTNLTQTNWINLGDVVTTTNSTATSTNSIVDPQQFYRVVLLP